MKNTIHFSGNTIRFASQKIAKLVDVAILIVKYAPAEWFDSVLGSDVHPRGTCIVLSFVGDKGIPFAQVRNYGSATVRRMRKLIGQQFDIEQGTDNNKHLQEGSSKMEEVVQIEIDGLRTNDGEDLPGVRKGASEGIIPVA